MTTRQDESVPQMLHPTGGGADYTEAGARNMKAIQVRHLYGDQEALGEEGQLERLIMELRDAVDSWPDVSVCRPDGVGLSIFRDGRLILENVEQAPRVPRRTAPMPLEESLRLVKAFCRGDDGALEALTWYDGYR